MALRVMVPDHDWGWLDQVSRNLARLVAPKYKRDRMQTLEALLDLGFRLMASADGDSSGRPADRAIRYRDGLIIALLVCCPLRRRNLAMMRIDRHLHRTRTGYVVLFEASETKMRTPIEVALPEWMSEPIDRYIREWRPLIHGSDRHDGIWASAKGVPMRPEAIYDRVCKHTREAFGRSVNPHLFRDVVATTIALDEPSRIGVASAILGHTNPETTRHYYVQAETVAATRALQETVRSLRASSRTS